MTLESKDRIEYIRSYEVGGRHVTVYYLRDDEHHNMFHLKSVSFESSYYPAALFTDLVELVNSIPHEITV